MSLSSEIFVSASVSGLFAGAAAILVTIVIEKFGGVVGGVLGSKSRPGYQGF